MNQSPDDNEEENEPEFPGLHYPLEYMIDTWLDHRRHGKYPDTGSYNDQDPLWLQDMRLMTARFNQWVRHLQKEGGEDVLEKLTKGEQGGVHWNELIKE